jgi:hypothetical protein
MNRSLFSARFALLNVAGRFDPQDSCAQRMTIPPGKA